MACVADNMLLVPIDLPPKVRCLNTAACPLGFPQLVGYRLQSVFFFRLVNKCPA
jgi:hypothetical protein